MGGHSAGVGADPSMSCHHLEAAITPYRAMSSGSPFRINDGSSIGDGDDHAEGMLNSAPNDVTQNNSDIGDYDEQSPAHAQHQHRRPTAVPFWVLGLLNNTSFVIMIASAKSISEGGTALVFISSVLPGLFVKLSAPYWFDRVSYRIRMLVGSILMAACFVVVGTFSGRNIAMELIGVALCSLQGSLGEASLLALAGKYDTASVTENTGESKKGKCITAFSSGTGLAGVAGFAYKVLLTEVFHWTQSLTLFLATGFAFLYWWTYWAFLDSHVRAESSNVSTGERERQDGNFEEGAPLSSSTNGNTNEDGTGTGFELPKGYNKRRRKGYDGVQTSVSEGDLDEWEDEFDAAVGNGTENASDEGPDIPSLTAIQRLRLSATFWPYMVPLFTVYAAEYALQSGTWTAIGFPVDSVEARDRFYEYSNWVYQVGVFVSRSSGTVYQASMKMFWLMPILQCINLGVFSYIAASHVWYDYSVLVLCFYVGLLGGGVYVNGYMRINVDLPKSIREFALSTVSVADTFGIIFADVVGLFIQSCLYKKNGIDGAVVQCPIG